MKKIIPKCPKCGSDDFRVSGPASVRMTIRNPKGRWTDQFVSQLYWDGVPEVFCDDCHSELPEDMATIVRFITYNHLRGGERRSSQDTPIIAPWSELRVFTDASGKKIIWERKED